MLQVKIKYLNKDLEKAVKTERGDWIDLRSAENITLKKGDFYQIPLGIAMQLPEGYEAHLTSRSSMCKKFGIVHVDDLGVIDSTYCGDDDQWFLPVMAVRDTEIQFNDRICQFRIEKIQPPFELVEVEELGNPNRGGLGSSGTK